MNKLFTLLFTAAALMVAPLAARTVSLGRVVCNPGCEIAVPVLLDEAQGLAVADVGINYNPTYLVLQSVEQGTLKTRFAFDFTVVQESGYVELISAAEDNIAESGGGTLAELRFLVREGSEQAVADLALADVRLHEKTMTVDLAAGEQTIVPQSGMIRPLAPTAACSERLGEGAVAIAAGTTLKHLTLLAGDTVQVAEGQPVTITEGLICAGQVTLAPPKGGWQPGRYTVLKAPGTLARTLTDFAILDQPAYATLAQAHSADGLIAYTLEVSDGTEVATDESGTAYHTLDSIPAGKHISLKAALPALITEANVRTQTAAHRVTGGLAAQSVANLLGGSFTAQKATAEAPTTLVYDYDLGVSGLRVTNQEGKRLATVVIGLSEGGQALSETRTLEGRTASLIIALGNGENAVYTLPNPTFTVSEAYQGMSVCEISVPWEVFTRGTNAISVKISDGE